MTDTEPTPPEPLTPAEAAKLVAWLNYAARSWPRVVTTLAMHRIPVEPAEFATPGGFTWGEPDTPRTPDYHRAGVTDFTVGFVELLSAFMPGGPGGVSLDTRIDRTGVTFVAHGLKT